MEGHPHLGQLRCCGGVAAITVAASTSRESTGVGWVEGVGTEGG